MSDYEYDSGKYNNQTVTTRYIRKDVEGGYLYNLDEINNFRLKQASEIIENLLLGDYNSEGYYIIDDKIIKELVNMPKLYMEGYNNSIFCVSENRILKYGKVNFAVVYKERNEGKQIEAQLQLLERIIKANGYYENTNCITIAKFVCENKSNFVELSMNAFNIYRNSDEMPAFIENELENVSSVQNILNRKNYLDILMNYIKKQRSKIEKETFLEKMASLKKSSKGKEIIALFEVEFTKLKPYFLNDKENYYSAVNDLFDRIINKNFDKIKNDKYTVEELNRADLNKNKAQSVLFDKGRVELLKNGDSAIKDQVINQQSTFDSTGQPKTLTVEKRQNSASVIVKQSVKTNEKQEQIGVKKSNTVNSVINKQYSAVKPVTQSNDSKKVIKEEKSSSEIEGEYHSDDSENKGEKNKKNQSEQSTRVFDINNLNKSSEKNIKTEKSFDIKKFKESLNNKNLANITKAKKEFSENIIENTDQEVDGLTM